jgi:protein O-GlcNAc transferase
MDYNKFKMHLNEVLAGRRDLMFDDVLSSIHCMSRPRVYAVLNACVSSLEPGELYVEVGTYQGGSLIAALRGNEACAIGVDSFSEFKETNDIGITTRNLYSFGVLNRVTLVNMDVQRFFTEYPIKQKIQVYYYDGAHDYETQLAGMETAWPFLQKGSLILVDDYTYAEVSRAVNQFVANHLDQIKFQFVMLPNENTDETWWNGCVLMRKEM